MARDEAGELSIIHIKKGLRNHEGIGFHFEVKKESLRPVSGGDTN